MSRSCPSCGAILAVGSDRCDLCGTRVGVEAPTPESAVASAPEATAAAGGAAYCIACGHANVPEARFCNRCGAAMPSAAQPDDARTRAAPPPAEPADAPAPATLPPTSDAPQGRPSSAAGARALWLVALGLLAVLVIYLVATSGDDAPAPAPVASAAPGAPPAAGPEPVIDPAAVADLALPPELERDAQAAATLVEGAERANTAAAWDDAGRLYLDLTRRAAPDLRPTLARQAIAAFTRSLEVADDADVRTRRVSAYRYDPATTMQPVTELQRVLGANPNHPEANFQMGELRLQIGRADSAAASFARAAASAPPGSVLQQDAAMMLQRAREQAAAPAAAGVAGG